MLVNLPTGDICGSHLAHDAAKDTVRRAHMQSLFPRGLDTLGMGHRESVGRLWVARLMTIACNADVGEQLPRIPQTRGVICLCGSHLTHDAAKDTVRRAHMQFLFPRCLDMLRMGHRESVGCLWVARLITFANSVDVGKQLSRTPQTKGVICPCGSHS